MSFVSVSKVLPVRYGIIVWAGWGEGCSRKPSCTDSLSTATVENTPDVVEKVLRYSGLE